MKRRDFLKRLGIGVAAAVVMPAVLAKYPITGQEAQVAMDVNSISGFVGAGKALTPSDILSIWRETGVFVYNSRRGNAPIVMQGDLRF